MTVKTRSITESSFKLTKHGGDLYTKIRNFFSLTLPTKKDFSLTPFPHEKKDLILSPPSQRNKSYLILYFFVGSKRDKSFLFVENERKKEKDSPPCSKTVGLPPRSIDSFGSNAHALENTRACRKDITLKIHWICVDGGTQLLVDTKLDLRQKASSQQLQQQKRELKFVDTIIKILPRHWSCLRVKPYHRPSSNSLAKTK